MEKKKEIKDNSIKIIVEWIEKNYYNDEYFDILKKLINGLKNVREAKEMMNDEELMKNNQW